MNDNLGQRMKHNYENAFRTYLPYRMPIIIRVDGRAFHTFTRDMERPFDVRFSVAMMKLSQYLLMNVGPARLTYSQSDEVSLLLHPYNKLTSEPWFGNEIQKIVSSTAALASAWFTWYYNKLAHFDARVFVLPESEVCNYFIWRQQDATRNSVQMAAQTQYSHKELLGKNNSELQEMLFRRGINWNDYESAFRRGFCVYRNDVGHMVDIDIPIFTQNRDYIERHLAIETPG